VNRANSACGEGICDSSRDAQAPLHAPNEELRCSDRILIPNSSKAAPIPVAQATGSWEGEERYDWDGICSHSRQHYSRHVFVPSLSRVRLPWGKLLVGSSSGQDRPVSRNCDCRSCTSICRDSGRLEGMAYQPFSINVHMTLRPSRHTWPSRTPGITATLTKTTN
jgi:hypothetical protein